MRTLRPVVRVAGAIVVLLSTATHASERPMDLSGTWIVQPHSPPGLVTRYVVRFDEQGERLTGAWSSNIGRARYKLQDISVEGDAVSFRVKTDEGPGLLWTGRFEDQDTLRMNWIWDDGTPVHARLMRRASPAEVAALEDQTPNNLVKTKITLPRLQTLPTNGLARTPIMGWSSWNHFKEAVDDKSIREIADALVASGLRDAGYTYVNIDDGWQGIRDQRGVLHSNSKFPDMKALAHYVHSQGLKLGIYSSPGHVSCGGYLGSHGYETQDAQTFARWGIDLLKHDWCSAGSVYKTREEMQALYQKMGEALQATGRPIVYSLCQYGLFNVGTWGRAVGANLWRTGGDSIIGDRWSSVSARFETNGRPEDHGPGGWNDPDILLIGNGGLTSEEQRTHMTLWAMLAAPLILGNDIRVMPDEEKTILTNREVIAIDQDALGKQGERVVKDVTREVWTKPLSDGSIAVALFNRGAAAAEMGFRWSELALAQPQKIRDLWRQTDLRPEDSGFRASLPAHGSMLLRVK